MKLSIICLNYSAPHYSSTENYMKALDNVFKHPPKCSFEVIVVDNGSTDNSAEKFKKKYGKKITIIQNKKNLGFQVGNNKGIEASKGEYVMTHNPDLLPHPGMFDLLVEYLETHPDVGIVGPQMLNTDGSIQYTYKRFMKPFDFLIKRLKFLHKLPFFKVRMSDYLMWKMDNTKTEEVDWLLAACIMMSRKNFDEIGGFDERFFIFNGDTDLCRKMWEHGKKVVYYPKAKAGHLEARLSGNGFVSALFKKTAWLHLIDMYRYFRKWGSKSSR